MIANAMYVCVYGTCTTYCYLSNNIVIRAFCWGRTFRVDRRSYQFTHHVLISGN